MITWLRFVPHDQMLAYLAKGWVISDEMHGTSHGHYAVLMVWAGDGEPSAETTPIVCGEVI